MESNNRNVWIVIAAILIVMCCCALVCAVAAAGWFTTSSSVSFGQTSLGHERIEQTFDVGSAPNLKIDNFAGSVTVHAGERGEIHVVAVKRASGFGSLDRIKVEMSEREGGVVIRTHKSSPLSNASVQIEVTAPPDTRLDLHTGAGSTEVRGLHSDVQVDTGSGSVVLDDISGEIDAHSGAGSIQVYEAEGTLTLDTGSGSIKLNGVSGEIDAHSGSGSMEAHRASGRVELDTGSGSIDYEGSLQGDCRFESGAGSITLRLPADLDMEVELDTGSGTISTDYDVVGHVSKQEVSGTIGHGDDGSIYAHTGTGSINLLRR